MDDLKTLSLQGNHRGLQLLSTTKKYEMAMSSISFSQTKTPHLAPPLGKE